MFYSFFRPRNHIFRQIFRTKKGCALCTNAHYATLMTVYNMYFQDLATPWLAILTSPAVWATSAAHFANNWGFYTMLTCLPTYMNDILKFDIKSVCIFSSPGPKVQVNYCHHLASVVCRLSSVNFSHFKLLLRNHLADWNRT